MYNPLEGTLMYCNRERTRKCNRYAKKHKCSFVEAYNKIYGTNYRDTYGERLEKLSMDTSVVSNTNKKDGEEDTHANI